MCPIQPVISSAAAPSGAARNLALAFAKITSPGPERFEGFTAHYNINRLVYYEVFKYVNNAIAREKQIKAWTRGKRIALIKSANPTWQDLASGWGERIQLQIPRSARDDNKSKELQAQAINSKTSE